MIKFCFSNHGDDVDGVVVASGEALSEDTGQGHRILGHGEGSLTSHNSERAVAAGDLPGKIGRPVGHLEMFCGFLGKNRWHPVNYIKSTRSTINAFS
jgi:hypothetical protein